MGPTDTHGMRTIPADSTVAFLREGYPFASSRFEAIGRDLFRTRLALRPVTFLRGQEAASLFYDDNRFTRQGAMPPTIQHLLQDKGSVQSLDGAAHRHRKQAFLSLMGPESMTRLGEIFDHEWHHSLDRLRGSGRVVLHNLSQVVLTRTAVRWAGIPLQAADLPRLTTELSLMFTQVARFGPANWYAQWRRRGTERWCAELIRQVREGQLSPAPGTAVEVLAHHRDERDRELSEEVAAVELLNILRPIAAVSLFIEFAAVALVEHPRWRAAFAAGDESDLEPFVQEVRRYYPFFPAVPGRARQEFSWRGHRFQPGDWVLLDLYGTCHDPALWEEPEAFRPERFRGWSWQEHPHSLIAQGAGRHETTHRCPGEWSTVELLQQAVRMLSREIGRLPAQDLSIPLDRFPTRPRSSVVLPAR